MGIKALFLDRDGVINIEKEYAYKIEDFEFIEGVFESLLNAQAKGYMLFIITNQSGIGRGYYRESDLHLLNDWMCEQFRNQGVFIQKVYYCPHAPHEACVCRKPDIGMLLQAQNEFGIDLKLSVLVGDKESDITAGKKAGVAHTFLVRSGHKIDENSTQADTIIDSLKNLSLYLKENDATTNG